MLQSSEILFILALIIFIAIFVIQAIFYIFKSRRKSYREIDRLMHFDTKTKKNKRL
ncbi:hypothetical protein LCGC14_2662350 [marine sediment metagenome]|uniref:Uncharacterized protein n=1 Tax=marine sediment metagenome TaxID=412755 RepID=A0A0F9ADY4_9ZZZZ